LIEEQDEEDAVLLVLVFTDVGLDVPVFLLLLVDDDDSPCHGLAWLDDT
jgi:hypothetical protein